MKMATGKEKFYSVGRSEVASQKRSQQLQVWEKSETNKEPEYIVSSRQTPKVKFGDNVIFLAAAQSGDSEEVERLIVEEGADVNSVNKDGLTALHQCCIDDDFNMVQALVKHGANIDAQDNEGWTPLHAAASCGHEHIVRFLLTSGVFPAPVNNEGDTPVDLAEDENVVDMIRQQIDKLGIDVEEVKGVEEAAMLEDAQRLKNDSSLKPPISVGGATLLHIAAAKNYLRVLKVLFSMKNSHSQLEAQDEDGWTPLHAAVYWGNMDAAEMLVLHGADMDAVTKPGDTVEELCDPDFQEELDGLRKLREEHNNRQRRNAMRSPSIIPRSRGSITQDNKPSPNVVRRKSSKERSFPRLDAMKERKERESWNEESVEGLNSSESISILEEKRNVKEVAEIGRVDNRSSKEHSFPRSDTNSVTEAVNGLKEPNASSSQQPVSSTSVAEGGAGGGRGRGSSDESQENSKSKGQKASSPQGSPKMPKRKPGMSPQMLKRVNRWETNTPTTVPSPLTSTPIAHSSLSSIPLISTSTPFTSTPLTSTPFTNGRKDEEGVRSSTDVKRYAFQPRTVSQSSLDIGGRSGLTRPTDSVFRRSSDESIHKRISYDENKLKATLKTSETEVKASSLPRGAKIVGVQEVDGWRGGVGSGKAVSRELKEGVVSSEGTPTPSAVTDEQGHRKDEDMSADSSASIASNKSTSEGSEARRKSRAKRARESRKATQPVPQNLMEQLKKGIFDQESEEDGEATAKEKPDVKGDEFKVVQSAYRPATRPAPKLGPTPTPSHSVFWPSPEKSEDRPHHREEMKAEAKVVAGQNGGDSVSKKGVEEVDKGRQAEGDSGLHPRTKSTTRRRPKRERRSTGIKFEADADEEVPDELAGLVVHKSADPDLSSTSEDYPESLDSSTGEELSRLKQALDEEHDHNQQLQKDHNRVLAELEKAEARVSELTRKLEDTKRAYEQEKRDKEHRETRITKLENELKSLQEVKKENQRMKDENSALIRVIGKLSRAPISTS